MPASFPDIPSTEIIQAQGPSAQIVGNRYAAIEYIEVLQRLPMGPQGPMGPTGAEGDPGAEWHFGSGPPTPTDPPPSGPNDMYVDDETGDVWQWDPVAGGWSNTGANFSGPVGPVGPQGVPGPTGPTGPEGPQGSGIVVVGEIPTEGQAPPFEGVPGEGWIDAAGHLWGWVLTPSPHWVDFGPITGPTGPIGPGVETRIYPFQFVSDTSNTKFVKMAITHDMGNNKPVVRALIAETLGGAYTSDFTMGVTYTGPQSLELHAEASIASYNDGRGQVVLQ